MANNYSEEVVTYTYMQCSLILVLYCIVLQKVGASQYISASSGLRSLFLKKLCKVTLVTIYQFTKYITLNHIPVYKNPYVCIIIRTI